MMTPVEGLATSTEASTASPEAALASAEPLESQPNSISWCTGLDADRYPMCQPAQTPGTRRYPGGPAKPSFLTAAVDADFDPIHVADGKQPQGDGVHPRSAPRKPPVPPPRRRS